MQAQFRPSTELTGIHIQLCMKHRAESVHYADVLQVLESDSRSTIITKLVKCEDCFVAPVTRISSDAPVMIPLSSIAPPST